MVPDFLAAAHSHLDKRGQNMLHALYADLDAQLRPLAESRLQSFFCDLGQSLPPAQQPAGLVGRGVEALGHVVALQAMTEFFRGAAAGIETQIRAPKELVREDPVQHHERDSQKQVHGVTHIETARDPSQQPQLLPYAVFGELLPFLQPAGMCCLGCADHFVRDLIRGSSMWSTHLRALSQSLASLAKPMCSQACLLSAAQARVKPSLANYVLCIDVFQSGKQVFCGVMELSTYGRDWANPPAAMRAENRPAGCQADLMFSTISSPDGEHHWAVQNLLSSIRLADRRGMVVMDIRCNETDTCVDWSDPFAVSYLPDLIEMVNNPREALLHMLKLNLYFDMKGEYPPLRPSVTGDQHMVKKDELVLQVWSIFADREDQRDEAREVLLRTLFPQNYYAFHPWALFASDSDSDS